MFLILFLCQLVFAETLVLSSTLSQEEAGDLSAKCIDLLQDEDELEVRVSRFFIKGVGYQYRVVVAGFPNEELATTVYARMQGLGATFELQTDSQIFEISKHASPSNDGEKRKQKQKEEEVGRMG